jgi:hypothetical protein
MDFFAKGHIKHIIYCCERARELPINSQSAGRAPLERQKRANYIRFGIACINPSPPAVANTPKKNGALEKKPLRREREHFSPRELQLTEKIMMMTAQKVEKRRARQNNTPLFTPNYVPRLFTERACAAFAIFLLWGEIFHSVFFLFLTILIICDEIGAF